MTLKRTLVNIHIWLGIIVGALWALQGATGAIMAFNRDIQPVLLSAAPEDSRQNMPLDEIFERASGAAGTKVEMLETFTPKPHLLLAHYKGPADEKLQLVVDARSGEVLDRRNPEAMTPSGTSTWYWLLRLHESLLAGEGGMYFTGTSGLLLLSSVVIGLWLGWPRRGQWQHAWERRRWRTTTQKLFGWHRMIGLTLGLVLIFSASCGTYLAFAPTVIRPALASAGVFRTPYKPAGVSELTEPAITAQQALDIARRLYPAAVMVRSTLPTEKAPVYGFRLLQADEWRRWAGTTTVFVDPASGKVLGSYETSTAPFFNKVNDNAYPLHTGEAGGTLLRLLIMLGGLSLPALYVTGVWAWLRKRRQRGRMPLGEPLGVVAAE